MTRLRDVNSTDLVGAIRLGCRAMSRCYNADDAFIPYGGAQVRPEARLGGSMEAHMPGRLLNALLNAEDAAGIEIDESAVDHCARAAYFSYSRAPLPLQRGRDREAGEGEPRELQDHDVREGFHALYALVAYRDSQQARELAEDSIRVLNRYWCPGEGWDTDGLGNDLDVHVRNPHEGTFIQRVARCIGPLVKLHRATASEAALELAVALKDKALREFFSEDGAFGDHFGHHAHSTTCVLSSLAQLAECTSDTSLWARVHAFYDNGLWELRDPIGWSIEVSDRGNDCLRGEANNTGDIVETALLLGRHIDPAYYEDAERILRSHLLPSQLRDVSFVVEPDNPDGVDGRHNVADRLRGGFGFPAPYGHEPAGLWTSNKPRVGFNLDIVGGAVGSLCAAFPEVTRFDAESGHWVNLLFDHVTPDIEVQSPYTHPQLRVRLRRPGPLRVRLPSWVDAASLALSGPVREHRLETPYLVLEAAEGQWITIGFDLPVHERELTWRHVRIRARFRGDEVVAMDDFGTDLTFFEPFE
jgi:hypothetical protein